MMKLSLAIPQVQMEGEIMVALSETQQKVLDMIPVKATAISKIFGKRHADQMIEWPVVVELRNMGLIEIVSMGSGRGVRRA